MNALSRIVLNETGLRSILKSHFDYYERARTHSRWRRTHPSVGRFNPQEWDEVEIPQVGGLHHRYERIAV
jgi:hypothetical protein